MTTVAQAFGKREPQLTAEHPSIVMQCGVGIELELEGISNLEVSLWNCTEDGSLRDGCEMVCARPYNGQQLFRAIHNLSDAVNASDAEGTWRCSTHVHMDMRDADSNILKKTILAWCFYEKVMFKCSGFHRYRSNFCPAFAVAQAQVMNASEAFNYEGSDFFNRLIHTWDKYTSLNLLPLMQYGSIEFRISEPKWKRSQLLNLVNRYLTLKKLAVENASMSNDEFIEHLNNVRFEPMLAHLPLDYSLDETDLDLGYRLARDVLYCRHHDVVVAGRLRIRQADAESRRYPASEMPHYNEYLGYIRRNSRQIYDRILAEYQQEMEDHHLYTERRFDSLITMLRTARTMNDNITDTVPRTWELEWQAVVDNG